jgi:hypothetical protein
MSDRDAYQGPGEDDVRQAVADETRELRRRLHAFAGIPAAAAARTPDPLPDMDTALHRPHAARRTAGMRELDDEGLALGVRLTRETHDELAALDQ